jgi:hypothetical protein
MIILNGLARKAKIRTAGRLAIFDILLDEHKE